HGSPSSVCRKSNAIFALPGHKSPSSVCRKSNTIFALPGHESSSSVCLPLHVLVFQGETLSKQEDWFSFAKLGDPVPVCMEGVKSALKPWKEKFFLIERRAIPFHERRMEDLQLGVESYQKRLNLTKPDTYRSDLKQREAYTAYSNPRGFIYQNKDKKNRFMRIDELHKFSDGTLNDVRNAFDDRLKGIRYHKQSGEKDDCMRETSGCYKGPYDSLYAAPIFTDRKSDKERAAAMIHAIDKQLKTRRIMRSLEKFVGGRLYEGYFRMLQRSI
nr:hypothetical protein [Tanacetum cinerariifolium]